MGFVRYDTQQITNFVNDYAKKLGFVENDEEQNEEMQLDYKTKLEQIKSNLMKKIIEDLRKNESITIERYWYWLDFETRIFADTNDIVKSKLDIEKNWFSIKSKAERFYKEELKEKQRKELEELQKIQRAELEKQIEQQRQQEETENRKKAIFESLPTLIFCAIILYLIFAFNYSIDLFLGSILFLIFVTPTVLGIIVFIIRMCL